MAAAAACWRWRNLDKQSIARRLALRLMAKAAGWEAQEKAEAEAMAKQIVLK
jgi:hypothetical protein